MSRVNPDRLVMCDGKSMTVRMASLKTGLAMSTIMKLHNAGAPIERKQRRGKVPMQVMHNGQMMTIEEIAAVEGLAVGTVRDRLRAGRPLGKLKRRSKGALVEHDGRMWTVADLARELGCEKTKIYRRLKGGHPLTGPVQRARREPRILESGEFRLSRAEGENGLYWADDLEARVWHMYCGGDDFGECTLAEIAALWELSRERIRQVETEAFRKIRQLVIRGDKDAVDALAWFKMRAEMRSTEKPGHWEQAEANAPGWFEAAS